MRGCLHSIVREAKKDRLLFAANNMEQECQNISVSRLMGNEV